MIIMIYCTGNNNPYTASQEVTFSFFVVSLIIIVLPKFYIYALAANRAFILDLY
mgnify:CR=1 FL=1